MLVGRHRTTSVNAMALRFQPMTVGRMPWWFATIFCVVGFVPVVVGGWLAVTQHYRLATYVPVPAHITQSQVTFQTDSKGRTSFKPNISYTYTVQNRSHQADRLYAMGNFSGGGDWAYKVCAQYPVGADATAWYSPQDPDSAFLMREPQSVPHLLALMGSVFLALGVLFAFESFQSRRLPKPPMPATSGWFALHETGTIRNRFWLYTAVTVVWWAYLAAVIGDCVAVNGYHLNGFCIVAGGIGIILGLIGALQSWRNWRLRHDFLDAEVCANCPRFGPGDSIQLRLRQGVQRPLEIKEIAFGAVCVRTDCVRSGNRVSYSSAMDEHSVWEKLQVDRAFLAGAELSAVTKIVLPRNASPSSPPRSSAYPLFAWSIVLRVVAQGQPELKVHFPIVVESKA